MTQTEKQQVTGKLIEEMNQLYLQYNHLYDNDAPLEERKELRLKIRNIQSEISLIDHTPAS